MIFAFKYPFLIIFFIFYFVVFSNSQTTQITRTAVCAKTEEIRNALINIHDEKMVWRGIAEDNSKILELFIEDSQGSWTLVETQSTGLSCAIYGGKESNLNNLLDLYQE